MLSLKPYINGLYNRLLEEGKYTTTINNLLRDLFKIIKIKINYDDVKFEVGEYSNFLDSSHLDKLLNLFINYKLYGDLSSISTNANGRIDKKTSMKKRKDKNKIRIVYKPPVVFTDMPIDAYNIIINYFETVRELTNFGLGVSINKDGYNIIFGTDKLFSIKHIKFSVVNIRQWNKIKNSGRVFLHVGWLSITFDDMFDNNIIDMINNHFPRLKRLELIFNGEYSEVPTLCTLNFTEGLNLEEIKLKRISPLNLNIYKNLKVASFDICDFSKISPNVLKNLSAISLIDTRPHFLQRILINNLSENLKSLECSEILDLNHIPNFTQLTYLGLGLGKCHYGINNTISNFHVLQNLKNLKKLTFIGCIKSNSNDYGKPIKNLLGGLGALTNYITDLNLPHNNLKRILGLEKFKNLKTLNLSNNQIGDISPLKDLIKLNKLNLSINHIRNKEGIRVEYFSELHLLNLYNSLKNLKSLINLKSLDLSNNLLEDISGLEYLIDLKSLNLSFNQLSNIEQLKNLRKLVTLNLSHNEKIGNNIKPLQDLINLTMLDFSYTAPLSWTPPLDLSNLKNLKNLEKLYLKHNYILNAEPLKNLVNLKILNLSHNQLTSLNIGNLVNLEKLDISNNFINNEILKDILGFEKYNGLNVYNMKELNITGNFISDINLLANLKNLEILHMDKNKIGVWYPPKGNFNNLKELYIGSNKIKIKESFGFFNNMKNLEILDLSNNNIENIGPLKELEELLILNLNNNNIKNVGPLQYLTKLKSLNISRNGEVSNFHLLKYLNLNLKGSFTSLLEEN